MASKAVAPETVGVKVGDFFYTSWGYDQTNIDFYKVVGLTPAGVKVQKWSKKSVNDGGSYCKVVPGDKPAMGREIKTEYGSTTDMKQEAGVMAKRLRELSPGRACFTVTSYATAFQWDGTPKYETAAGWGH